MSFELVTYRIEQIADVIGGGTPSTKREDFYGGDIPWITPKDLSGYSDVFISNGARNITELGLKSSSARTLPKNSILFTSRAPIGYVAIAEKEVSTNQGFKSLIPKSNLLDYKFAYYMMKYYAPRIEAIASGSTFKEVSGSVVKNFEVTIPKCIKAQRKIAETLFSLDEGIQNNTRMNQTLEKIAQRIFKSWFIDFDPVKANAEGVPYADLSPDIQSLFPSEFVESEMGLIPKGWEAGKAEKSIKAMGGFAFKSKDFSDEGIPVVKIKNITNDRTIELNGCDRFAGVVSDKLSKFVLVDGDILMAMTGATVGKVGIFTDLGQKGLLNQRVAKITNKEGMNCWYAYMSVTQSQYFNTIVTQAYGSAQPNISAEGITSVSMVNPNNEVINAYNLMIEPLFEKIIQNRKQNSVLQKLRDKLLPKLLSGSLKSMMTLKSK